LLACRVALGATDGPHCTSGIDNDEMETKTPISLANNGILQEDCKDLIQTSSIHENEDHA
jgi:hypothetical protein